VESSKATTEKPPEINVGERGVPDLLHDYGLIVAPVPSVVYLHCARNFEVPTR